MISLFVFEENIDFVVSLKNEQNLKPLGGRPSVDYFYVVDAAKEISMLQRTYNSAELLPASVIEEIFEMLKIIENIDYIVLLKNEYNLNRAVSARELHEFLGSREQFTDWIERMFDYGFEENIDYIVFHKNVKNPNSSGGRPTKEYFLTIETAKEISMLQRTDKGKEARRYFIECEKKLKLITLLGLKEC